MEWISIKSLSDLESKHPELLSLYLFIIEKSSTNERFEEFIVFTDDDWEQLPTLQEDPIPPIDLLSRLTRILLETDKFVRSLIEAIAVTKNDADEIVVHISISPVIIDYITKRHG